MRGREELFGNGRELDNGLTCLAFGWLTVPWYANPLLLFAAIANAYRSHEVAIFFSVLAIAAALLVFAYPREVRPYVGYYMWLASMIATLIAAITGLRARRDANAVAHEPTMSVPNIEA